MAKIHGKYCTEAWTAAADVTSNQYLFCKQTAADQVNKAGAGEETIGIFKDVSNADAAGDPVTIVTSGNYILKVDGSGTAISIGDKLKSNASGLGVKVSADEDIFGAVAREASSAANDLIEVEIRRGYYAVA